MSALINTPNITCASTESQFKFGYYAELANAKSVLELKQYIQKVITRLGFSEYAYIRLSRYDTYQPELSTLPTQMMLQYFESGFYKLDMSLQRAKKETLPFFQSTIHHYITKAPFKSDMTHCMQEIQTLNKQFGYYDFYSIPIKPCEGTDHAMLTIAHQSMGPIELKRSVTECSPDLSLLCEAIDFVTTHKFSEFFCQDKHKKSTQINPKPLRVLNTLANNDLTINQVADKLCISVVTANQHLKTVRRSLGTHTNYAAIKQAVLNNLIQFK